MGKVGNIGREPGSNAVRMDRNREKQSIALYSIGSYNSGAMISDNPNAGIHLAQKCRTIDLNGLNPSCYQGGIAIVEFRRKDMQGEIMSIGHDIRSSKFAEDGKTDPLMETDYKDPIKVTSESIVRRITPIECERLQGFPDGWTDIGDWTDTKGKVHKPSDSARYKALGNSICLPFWFWLLRRISAQYERPATMGSLFDGIGGFPLCWERCNGQGTALWASEIEEFPIAVTKKHFPEVEEDD